MGTPQPKSWKCSINCSSFTKFHRGGLVQICHMHNFQRPNYHNKLSTPFKKCSKIEKNSGAPLVSILEHIHHKKNKFLKLHSSPEYSLIASLILTGFYILSHRIFVKQENFSRSRSGFLLFFFVLWQKIWSSTNLSTNHNTGL